jgi:hypothetical protein
MLLYHRHVLNHVIPQMDPLPITIIPSFVKAAGKAAGGEDMNVIRNVDRVCQRLPISYLSWLDIHLLGRSRYDYGNQIHMHTIEGNRSINR